MAYSLLFEDDFPKKSMYLIAIWGLMTDKVNRVTAMTFFQVPRVGNFLKYLFIWLH